MLGSLEAVFDACLRSGDGQLLQKLTSGLYRIVSAYRRDVAPRCRRLLQEEMIVEQEVRAVSAEQSLGDETLILKALWGQRRIFLPVGLRVRSIEGAGSKSARLCWDRHDERVQKLLCDPFLRRSLSLWSSTARSGG